MKVLVACEFSGVVRDAFRAKGHDAWSCDLLPTERDGQHFQCDVLSILGDGWDLMIAHPPCTFLTNAGVRHLHDSVASRNGVKAKIHGAARWHWMEKAAEFFCALKNAPIEHICIENPIPHGYARKIIGDYDELIQPWMFGHGEVKPTCLWLKNLPMLQATHAKDDLFCKPDEGGRFHKMHMMSPSKNRWKERSRTYQGIADAMAEQWGNHRLTRTAARVTVG